MLSPNLFFMIWKQSGAEESAGACAGYYSSLKLTSHISYTGLSIPFLQDYRTELKTRLEVLESVAISSTTTVDEWNTSLPIVIKIPPLIVAT
jgi:hypothetical protein